MKPFSLNLRGRLMEVERPLVMGILNITPDSFYGPSRQLTAADTAAKVRLMALDGVDIIDIGGYSTRRGAADVSPEEEMRRVECGVETARAGAPGVLLSVDTFRSSVAAFAVEKLGVDIVNDISGGDLDPEMIPTVSRLGVPYVMGHTRGTPYTMASLATYADVVADVAAELSEKLRRASLAGIADVIIDPGFGFAKTPEQSLEMLGRLEEFECLGCPLMVGLSRKSMLTSTLGITADEALAATIAANAFALDRGAAILRVHDVEAARHAVDLYSKIAVHRSPNAITIFRNL